jgi:hypothetical protein
MSLVILTTCRPGGADGDVRVFTSAMDAEVLRFITDELHSVSPGLGQVPVCLLGAPWAGPGTPLVQPLADTRGFEAVLVACQTPWCNAQLRQEYRIVITVVQQHLVVTQLLLRSSS